MGWGRAYFGVQATAGAVWWITVFLSSDVRTATLGELDPVVVALWDVPLFVLMSALAAFGGRIAAVVATAWTTLVASALAGYATMTTLAGAGAVLMIASAAASVVALFLLCTGRVLTERLLIGPLRFRTASPAATRFRHVRATAVQVAIFWGVLLGVVPLVIGAFEQRWQLSVEFPLAVTVAGWIVFALAIALGIWAAVVMSTRGAGTPLPSDTATRFVVGGPYRFVRSPMALAGIAQGAAVGLMVSSWLVVIYAVCGSLVWNFIVRPHEERDLEARFGGAFRRYREQVRCWWPRLRPIPASVTAGVPQPSR
ncbi:methyltransferase family protein [Microbacterium wangchenii]|uniref:methyltransferase family protein n=1 Tax=Microbacterium wangchenii TaxID=2541726 RepID=UPI0011C7F2E7|nr:isoprenylcysteine carboxylmethyltransferase family protein [Microbacterium wangchenii]TXK20571.1 isoprenylcysteine carboxylmethyltransferase family protein [Microbacterium wangchenii]